MELLHKYIAMFRRDLADVMSRRCGLDELNSFIMLVGFVFVLISLFSGKSIFTLFGLLFVILCYVRVFSKKLDRRRKENAIYLRYMGGVVTWCRKVSLILRMQVRTWKDKEYAYFVCGTCGQIVRVPKGKNKISIRCPKCGTSFVKRT